MFGWCGEAHWLQRWIKKGEIDEKASDFLFSTNKSSLLRKLQEAESDEDTEVSSEPELTDDDDDEEEAEEEEEDEEAIEEDQIRDENNNIK